MSRIMIPVSIGELVDKVTILRIKLDRLADASKKANVRSELTELEAVLDHEMAGHDYQALAEELSAVNSELWDIEEGKRDCERHKTFDERFVGLARSVYIKNDLRAAIKRRLNELAGSAIVEEKSYAAY